VQHVNPYIQPAGDSGARVNLQHPLGRGCVGWWEMNVGSGLVVPDISGQNNHGTMTNMDAATDWVQGRRGGEGALEFDGSDDYVNCGDAADLAGDFTLSMVLNADAWDIGPRKYNGIVSKRDTYAGMAWQFYYNGQVGAGAVGLTMWFGASGVNKLYFGTTPSAGQWHSIILTRAGNNFTTYVDGLQDAVLVDANAIPANADSVRIAALGGDVLGNPDYVFDGRFANAAIYSRALPASEIAHLYAEPYAPIWTPGEHSAFDWFAYGAEYALSLRAEAPGAVTTIFPVVVFSPTPDNSSTATPQQCNFELMYNEGVSVTLTAPSSDPPGYRWDGWWNSDGRIQWPKEYVFSLTDSRVVIAHYIHSHDGVR